MGARLTFLHAADIHLGAPFRGLRALSDAWADRLIEAIPEAYDRLIDIAIREQVDFAVFAGDVFDTSRPSYADYLRFFSGLKRLAQAGIPAYVCTGNHDPYTSWERDFGELPEGAMMFSAEAPSFALYERDGEPLCVLAGRGYFNQTWPADLPFWKGLTRLDANKALGSRAEAAPFGIGVAHTGLTFDPRNAPADPRILLEAGFDYWALGHIHQKMLIPSDNPRIGYSGCIQGRDIAETGERGAYLVTLEEESLPQVRFVPTASVVWQRLSVDVTECENLAAVTDKVSRELFRVNGSAHCEEMVVRVTLVGTTPLHATLARSGVIEDLRETISTSYAEFFCDALIDKTRPPIDAEALRREGLFPAAFLKVADALCLDAAATDAYVQDEFIERGLKVPTLSPDDIARMSDEARALVLELLVSEEEHS